MPQSVPFEFREISEPFPYRYKVDWTKRLGGWPTVAHDAWYAPQGLVRIFPSFKWHSATLSSKPVDPRRNSASPATKQPGTRNAQVLALPLRAASDHELVAGLCEGRASAVRALYDQHAVLVRQILTRVIGANRDIEDLVQETLITVVERAPALKKASSLRSFIVGVALNFARNDMRRRALRKFIGLEEALHVPTVAPHDTVMAQGLRHVYEVLARLEVNSRMAFVLRRVQGFDLAEIATACGCSLATVKRRLDRAESRFAVLAQADPVLRELLHNGGRAP